MSMQHTGSHGMQPWSVRSDYKTYQSKFGPAYRISPNFHGISVGRAMKFGATAAAFAGVAGTFALFFFAEVPRVRKDIMQRMPLIGDYFVREVPPEDNPF